MAMRACTNTTPSNNVIAAANSASATSAVSAIVHSHTAVTVSAPNSERHRAPAERIVAEHLDARRDQHFGERRMLGMQHLAVGQPLPRRRHVPGLVEIDVLGRVNPGDNAASETRNTRTPTIVRLSGRGASRDRDAGGGGQSGGDREIITVPGR